MNCPIDSRAGISTGAAAGSCACARTARRIHQLRAHHLPDAFGRLACTTV